MCIYQNELIQINVMHLQERSLLSHGFSNDIIAVYWRYSKKEVRFVLLIANCFCCSFNTLAL